MIKLPDRLSRKAVALTFDKISPVAWEKLFEREDNNGLAKLRVAGDFQTKVYYSTEGLIHWLIRNDRYTIEQIRRINGESQPQAMTVRTHVLAG